MKHRFANVDREGWHRQLLGPFERLSELERSMARVTSELSSLVYFRKPAIEAFDDAYRDALHLITVAFQIARFDPRAIKILKPYCQRRILSRKAREKRETRAAQAAEQAAEASSATLQEEGEKKPARLRPLAGEARANLSKSVARWLDKRRVAGS